MKFFVAALLVLTYVLMIVLKRGRVFSVLCSAAIFVALGIVPLTSLPGTIDFGVIMMLGGMMGTVALFTESGMPMRIAGLLLSGGKSVMSTAVILSLFAGIVSAFIDNVATVLMVAPIGLAAAQKMKVSPIPLLILISVSSNLQGAATLVGDTTSVMFGSFAGLGFSDFFFKNGHPGIFFAVECGALATIPVIMYLFKGNKNKSTATETVTVKDIFPTVMLLSNIIFLIVASIIPGRPAYTSGLICLAVFIVGFIHKAIAENSFKKALTVFSYIDFETLLLIASLFVVIGGVTNVGIIDDVSALFAKAGKNGMFFMYLGIVWGSVLISAFVDNIPYVAAMLPVISRAAAIAGFPPMILYYGLLIGATLGGNITPIGASANITSIGILRKNGYEVSSRDFMRISVPFTITAAIVGSLFCWFFGQ